MCENSTETKFQLDIEMGGEKLYCIDLIANIILLGKLTQIIFLTIYELRTSYKVTLNGFHDLKIRLVKRY